MLKLSKRQTDGLGDRHTDIVPGSYGRMWGGTVAPLHEYEVLGRRPYKISETERQIMCICYNLADCSRHLSSRAWYDSVYGIYGSYFVCNTRLYLPKGTGVIPHLH